MQIKTDSTIIKELEKYKEKDYTFSSGHILGSMCTNPHPVARKAYIRYLDTNLGDPDLFPGAKEIEQKYLSFLKKLLNAPKTSTGIIGSGGTESNITAMWIAKNLTKKKEVIIPNSAHFSFDKIASLMDIKIVSIPLTKTYVLDTKKVRKKINKNTAAVVGVAGSTELGTIDPLPEISEICDEENVFLHVDAAFGGYVIPFLKELGYDVPDFDFKLKGVNCVSIDAHKMGCSAIPLGTLMIRDKKWLQEISVESHCVSTKTQSGILGTRSGGPVAAAYAVSKYLRREGYKELVRKCMDTTIYTQEKIENIGLKLVIKPTMNVLGIKLKKPVKVTQELTKKGWKLNKMDKISSIRIVLMPHVTKKTIDDFIPDFKKVCREIGEI